VRNPEEIKIEKRTNKKTLMKINQTVALILSKMLFFFGKT